MKQFARLICGFNIASTIRGLRFGLPELEAGCLAALGAVHPCQNRAAHDLELQLKLIPIVTLDEILGAKKPLVSFEIQKYEDGVMQHYEAIALLSIMVAEEPKEVLEIGTFLGHTTKALAANLPGGLVHTVDLPPDFSAQDTARQAIPKDDFHLIRRRVVGREFKGQPVEARIKQHFGDTANIDFQKFGRPNFFFIDGSHTYEYCKQDSEKCYQLCNGRGTFFWHDCDTSHPGVVKFINEWRAAGRNISLIQGTHLAYWKSPATGGR